MNERLTEEKSIYLQIGEMIETDILRGILLEEEQVPSDMMAGLAMCWNMVLII